MCDLCTVLQALCVSQPGASVQDLASHGCTLYMVCRNEEKGRDAVKEVVEASGESHHTPEP